MPPNSMLHAAHFSAPLLLSGGCRGSDDALVAATVGEWSEADERALRAGIELAGVSSFGAEGERWR